MKVHMNSASKQINEFQANHERAKMYRQYINLQLIAMIEDATDWLADEGIHIEEKVFMNGFSACGFFTNRFIANLKFC